MRNLLEFLIKHNHWFLFVLLEAVSFVLVFQFNSYQGSVWFSSANAVAGKANELTSSVKQYFALADVNQELSERNVYLQKQVEALTQELKDQRPKNVSDTLRRAEDPLAGCTLIKAKVVDNTLNRVDNFITIDKGESDGVRRDMGVVSGTGVVGIVYLVSQHYSVVIPVLNSHSNISCTIRRRGYFGYLHWQGGAADVAYVDDIPRHARFNNGDMVVTSGYSTVFPAGIEVGRIRSVYNSENGLSYRLKINLSTDFGNLRDVFVISNASIGEKRELIKAANDSIKVKS